MPVVAVVDTNVLRYALEAEKTSAQTEKQ